MNTDPSAEHAIAVLQELGLKEYDARCFVALTRLPTAKAREVAEVADVPRTRVYDAVERLAELGLVEIQHTSPKQFRAIGTDEALDVLRVGYDRKFAELGTSLDDLESISDSEYDPDTPGVWTLSGIGAIRARARELLDDADAEVVYLIGDESVVADRVLDGMAGASERGHPIFVGTAPEAVYERIADTVPGAQRLDSWSEWLWTTRDADEAWTLGQILVVDRHAVLVSAHRETTLGDSYDTAVWTRGVGNGLGMVAERLLRAGIERLGETADESEARPDGESV